MRRVRFIKQSASDIEAARALFLSNTAEERVEALDIISIASNSATSAVDYAKVRSRSSAPRETVLSSGRTIWIADAHRDGKRFVGHVDEKADGVCGT